LIYRLTVLLEEKVDLEAIHDINEEMQENARQVDYSIYPLSLANVVGYGIPPKITSGPLTIRTRPSNILGYQ
jgi:hypothetical protein